MQDNDSARKDLAAAVRALAWYKMQYGVFNHCSALAQSKSGNRPVVLLPPIGLFWQDATPECFVGLDLETGEVVEGNQKVSGLGKCIHIPIYRHRPDVKSIVHVHSDYATAQSCLKDPHLMMLSQTAASFYDDVAYGEYKLAESWEEGEAIAASLGDSKNILMMLNHGLLTVGPTVAVAFERAYSMEAACKFQMIATSSGKELSELSHETARKLKTTFGKFYIKASQCHLDAFKSHFDKAIGN